MWFIGSLKRFFGLRQLPTAQSSPRRQRSTKSTKTTSTTVPVDNRNLPSDDSDVEGSPFKSKSFQALFRSPAKQKSKWETRTDNNIREIAEERRGNIFDGVSPQRVGLGGAVKDGGVVGPRVVAVTVVLGARLGSGGRGRR
jgi:hypothetical protein